MTLYSNELVNELIYVLVKLCFHEVLIELIFLL